MVWGGQCRLDYTQFKRIQFKQKEKEFHLNCTLLVNFNFISNNIKTFLNIQNREKKSTKVFFLFFVSFAHHFCYNRNKLDSDIRDKKNSLNSLIGMSFFSGIPFLMVVWSIRFSKFLIFFLSMLLIKTKASINSRLSWNGRQKTEEKITTFRVIKVLRKNPNKKMFSSQKKNETNGQK